MYTYLRICIYNFSYFYSRAKRNTGKYVYRKTSRSTCCIRLKVIVLIVCMLDALSLVYHVYRMDIVHFCGYKLRVARSIILPVSK